MPRFGVNDGGEAGERRGVDNHDEGQWRGSHDAMTTVHSILYTNATECISMYMYIVQ